MYLDIHDGGQWNSKHLV